MTPEEISQIRYRQIVEDQTELVCRYSTDYHITFANHAYCQAYGATPEEIVGREFFSKIPEEEHQMVRDYIASLTKENPVSVTTHRTILADGRIRWVEWKDRAILDDDGNIIEYQGVGRDITEQKLAEDALRASEKVYRQMFELHGVPKLLVDPATGAIIDANPAACHYYGYDLVTMRMLKIWDINQLTKEQIYEKMSHATGSQTLSFEFVHKLANGELRDVQVFSGPIEVEGKRLLYSIITDITEKNRAKRALEEVNHLLEQRVQERTAALQSLSYRLELATKAAGIGIWDLDIVANRVTWDDRMYEIYGVPKGTPDLLNVWANTIHPEDRARVLGESQRTLQEIRYSYDIEFRIMYPNGAIAYIKDMAIILRDEHDKPYRAVGVNIDITESKFAQETLRMALEKEKELGDLKTNFMTMASHEFRTPLATILAGADILSRYRSKLSEAQIDERLDKIRQQVMHIKDMLENVLQVVQVQSGRVEFLPTKTNLCTFCKEVVDEFEVQPNYRGKIKYTYPTPPIMFTFDIHLMHHIITNLLSNALRYSLTDASVSLELTQTTKSVIIRVKDSGMGIPSDDMRYLFEPFHRGSNVSNITGTGLGLSIVKQAVDLHNGTVSVESVLGEGSCFVVELPKMTYEQQ